MTALQLLAYIVAALLIQLALGLGFVVVRWRSAPKLVHDQAAEPPPLVSTGAWSGWREFRVARREFEDGAHTQCSFYLEPVDGALLPAFRPGQFLTFSLPIAGRVITRCYSLSDQPDPRCYRITVKRVPSPADRPDLPPGLSSNHFHDGVHEGDVLKVRAPAGHFFIDPDPAVPAVLIAGGIGITPMMSMLSWCLAAQPERTVHLYYGLRHGQEHAFKQDLARLAQAHATFHLNVVYSAANAADIEGHDFQHQGHVTLELLKRTLPHGRHQFYICGPSAMMASLVPALADWGVPAQDVHFEAFGPASAPNAAGAVREAPAALDEAIEVRFKQSARTLTWDGQDANLLDFAERQGVLVESGCRSGGCGSCAVRLVSGEVRYAHRPDYDVEAGYCLLCVGRPASDLVIEA